VTGGRRRLRALLAGLLGIVILGAVVYLRDQRTVRVGILHSTQGSLAASEGPVLQATRFGVEEVGRVLGHRVEVLAPPVDADDPASFARAAESLIEQDVAAIFGCWTSASRRAVIDVLKDRALLYYPVFYEGLETSEDVIHLGATANQRILPATRWARIRFGPKFFLIGSDYVFPRAAHQLIEDDLADYRGAVVGSEFIPLQRDPEAPEAFDRSLAAAVQALMTSGAVVVVNTVNGDTNTQLLAALERAGSTHPVLSFAISEVEAEALPPSDREHYVAWSYLDSLPVPENQEFLGRWRHRHPGAPVSEPIVSGYVAVQLWAAAAEEAGTFDREAVREATRGLAISAPWGAEYIDPETLHAWRSLHIARIDDEGEFDVVWSEPAPVPADPWPGDRSPEEWKKLIPGL